MNAHVNHSLNIVKVSQEPSDVSDTPVVILTKLRRWRRVLLERYSISTTDTKSDSDVISSFHIYASCFPTVMRNELWAIFVFALSLSEKVGGLTDIFLNWLIQFYWTVPQISTLHITLCCPATQRSYRDRRLCDVTPSYKLKLLLRVIDFEDTRTTSTWLHFYWGWKHVLWARYEDVGW